MPEHQQTHQSKSSEPSSQRRIIPSNHPNVSNPASIIQRARIDPKSLTHADVLQLQCTIGNRAVGRLLSEIRSPSITQQALVQRQEIPEEKEPLQGVFEKEPEEETCPSCSTASIQRKGENRTGMPDNLKAGVENLSGIDMSDIRVHYDSSKPEEIGALAYTQGTDIHVASGQERHLPHEAWHVVQQAQGRVQPTMQMKDGISVNDDEGLEHEADVIGERASTSGRDVFFRKRVYESESRGGQELIAHELTHVVQQNGYTMQLDPSPPQLHPQHPRTEVKSVLAGNRVIREKGEMTSYGLVSYGLQHCKNIVFPDCLQTRIKNLSSYSRVSCQSGIVQRVIPTREEWKLQSQLKFKKRSKKLKAVDAAVTKYELYRNLTDPEIEHMDEGRKQTARGVLAELLETIHDWRENKRSRSKRISAVNQLEQEACAEVVRMGGLTDEQNEQNRQMWDPNRPEWSKPDQRNRDNFQYLVNALTPGVEHRERIQADPGQFQENRGLVSTSIINQMINTVWAPSGYILRVPMENIKAAFGGDTGTMSDLHDTTMEKETRRLGVKFGIRTPAQVLHDSSPGRHNEVSVSAQGLEVIGIFVIEDPDSPLTPLKAGKIMKNGANPILSNGRTVIKLESVVSDSWMENYRATSAARRIPIIYIQQARGATISGLTQLGCVNRNNVNLNVYIWYNDLSQEEQIRVNGEESKQQAAMPPNPI